mmetsp:Transcript_58399/g.125487  ORF Transcript_58399/g.125487 Transcript_58399/m.125487 type:complete len:313 (+) Transcript_58399:1-939(+)
MKPTPPSSYSPSWRPSPWHAHCAPHLTPSFWGESALLPHCLPSTCMKYGVPGPPAPASGCASSRVRVFTPSSSESHTSRTLSGLSNSSSTVCMGTILFTHSRARRRSSSASTSPSSIIVGKPPIHKPEARLGLLSAGALAPSAACHLRNCEESRGEVRAAKASTLGVVASKGGKLRLGSIPSPWPLAEGGSPGRGNEPELGVRLCQEFCQEFCRLAVGVSGLLAKPGVTGGASARRGPKLAPSVSPGDVSPQARWRKGCECKACAAGRFEASTVRHWDKKSPKSCEKLPGSFRPDGGLLLMTNIARVGGMWK